MSHIVDSDQMRGQTDSSDRSSGPAAGVPEPGSTAPVTVRLAEQTDFDAILDMLAQLIKENPAGHSPDWPDSGEARSVVTFHLERRLALVAECDGVVVGHISWRIGQARPPQIAIRYAEVESIYIIREYRGQDVAKKLCEAFLTECERKAISVTRVNARPDEATVSLFESCGFREERRLMIRTTKSPAPSE